MKIRNCVWLLWLLWFIQQPAFSQHTRSSTTSSERDSFPSIKIDIHKQLEAFYTIDSQTNYRIYICADVPNNKKPLQVAYKQETGHVFLILQKIDVANDTISSVFGFYPKGQLSTLLFKKVKSVIKDNSYRQYDVAISRQLSKEQFDTVLSKAIVYSKKKYHINKYNCYNYAIDIFNSVAGKDSLPILPVRFPFIFGKGGSPCSIYRSFKELVRACSPWSNSIHFAEMTAPASTIRSDGTIIKPH